MFDGFEMFDAGVRGVTIHGRRGGSGPPLLLLHGMPETHQMWHRVAPSLAEEFTGVATDLCGYGDSSAPLAVLDVVPTAEAFARADARFALGFWVWCCNADPRR